MADRTQPTTTREPVRAGPAAPRSGLDPTTPLLVQPYKRLVNEGFIMELRISFKPTGTVVEACPGEKLVEVVGSGLKSDTYYAVAVLARIAELGNVIPKPGKSGKGKAGGPKTPELPKKSLCIKDFAVGSSPATLQKRANEVAAACGGGPLVGRVRSAGIFKGTESQSYQDWWAGADPKSRAVSLCQGKALSELTDVALARLGGLQCPFRGTLEFTVAEQDEEEEEETPAPRISGPATPPNLRAARTSGTTSN